MPIFNLKHNTFMSLFTHHLCISQWKTCLPHIASLNNIRKNGSSPLICILSSILEYCTQQVVPITLHLSHCQATRKGVLWRIFQIFQTYCLQLCMLQGSYCLVTADTNLLWHYIYHTAQSQIFFCILSNTHSTKNVPNKPSKIQRSILYIKCAQIF